MHEMTIQFMFRGNAPKYISSGTAPGFVLYFGALSFFTMEMVYSIDQ